MKNNKFKVSDILGITGIFFILIFTFLLDFRIFIFKSTFNAYIFVILGFVLVIIGMIKKEYKINKINILWIATIIFVLFGKNYGFTIKYILGLLLLITFNRNIFLGQKCIKYIYIFGIFFSIFTFVFFLFPNLYISKVVPMLNEYLRDDAIIMMRTNRIPGLTGHYSTNGIYLSMSLGAAWAVFMTKEKKTKERFFTVIYILGIILALMLIGKRAHLIFSILSVIIVIWVYQIDKKVTRIKKMAYIVFSGIIGSIIIINFFPALSNTFNRFIETAKDGDFLMSRGIFYKESLRQFINNPILGIGWGSMQLIIKHNVHNIYIQLLAETGILGFLIYMSLFLYGIYNAIKLIKIIIIRKIQLNSNEKICMLFSVYYQIFFILYGITGNPLYDEQTLWIYMISYGMVLNLIKKYKEIKGE